MKDKGTKKETDTELLARLMAEGFGDVKTRLDVIDVRLDEIGTDITSLQKGQTEIHYRLDSIDKKQTGMLESLDETVHQSEFRKLVQRVDILEKQPR
jgi:hypothetical protein